MRIGRDAPGNANWLRVGKKKPSTLVESVRGKKGLDRDISRNTSKLGRYVPWGTPNKFRGVPRNFTTGGRGGAILFNDGYSAITFSSLSENPPKSVHTFFR